MRCGIKYCGGCNPRFDRVGFVHRLREQFPQVAFLPFLPQEAFDYAVTVCGCPSRCAGKHGVAGLHGSTVICAEEAFLPLCNTIAGLLEAGQEE